MDKLTAKFCEFYCLKFQYNVTNDIVLVSDFYVSKNTMKTALKFKISFEFFVEWYEKSLTSDVKNVLTLEKYLKMQ